MPARRIATGADGMQRFDVVGIDSGAEPTFVGHVALVDGVAQTQRSRQSVPLTHMIPPFRRRTNYIRPPMAPITVHGTAELVPDEISMIESFVNEISSEYEAEMDRRTHNGVLPDNELHDQFKWDQYSDCPHVRKPDAFRSFYQFSCAGFVLEAYRMAGIDLVEGDSPSFPRCNLETLRRAYHFLEDEFNDPQFRADKGLDPDSDRWPVMLPGFIFNSLDRPSDDIRKNPYCPAEGDEYFPSRRPVASNS